jgi:hypothetical protein
MTHKLDADDFFIHRVQQHCAEAQLNFFLVEPTWVEHFFEKVNRGEVWPRALLNMHSEHHQPTDIFHRVVRLATERQSFVIDPPDRALAAFDKARLHPRLVEAGIPVPPTVIVPRERVESFQLSEEQRTLLGTPFVIKPALGYGRRGVVMDATSEKDLLRSAAAWPDGDYLLQRRIVARTVKEAPAYFRVYFVFGTVWSSWWNCFSDRYRLTTEAEIAAIGLQRLEETVRQIAKLTGMSFFSSEMAQVETGEFVVIDYLNDQCHMLSQSSNPQIGVPNELVAAIARRLVEAVAQRIARPR